MARSDWAPDAVLDLRGLVAVPGARVLEGRPAIEAFLADWRSAWSRYDQRDETVTATEDRALRAAHIRARGRDSGVGVEAVVWQVDDRRDGRVVQARLFDGEAAARAAWRR